MHRTQRQLLGAAFAGILLTATAQAQQFQQQAGIVPGPVVWTEGVISFDADGDGDLDVCFANGDGFNTAGTPRLPTLLMNNGMSGGNPVFNDETATRLPAITLNAKSVLAFDMDLDGDEDLFFSQAYNKVQKLYENDGNGNFTDVSAQIPATTLNSFGANAGDVDDDGDLDLVLAHHGGNNLTGTGGQIQLWRNDGSGTFTDVTAATMPVIGKTSQQNATFVDLDSDYDLDVVLDGRSTPQHAYFNSGNGTFSVVTNILPAGTSSIYDTDWADLDGDTDVDGFYTSLASFNEGTAKNNLVENGTLSFTGSTATIIGTNGFDDNEISFLDYDVDGDYDVLVGALGGTSERLYRNNGNFTFTFSGAVSAQGDSTLDVTVGDFDGDGDYDFITAQGESGGFLNRYYRNFGLPDNRDPIIVGTRVTDANVADSDLIVRARITDATLDDGVQFVTADLNWTVAPLVGPPVSDTVPMLSAGGSLYRGEIGTFAVPGSSLGATVTYDVTATDGAGNTVTSAQESFVACGAELYGGAVGGANVLFLSWTNGAPRIGQSFSLVLTGGQANAPGIMIVGVSKASAPFVGGTLLVAPLLVVNVAVGPSGSFLVPVMVPNDPTLVGASAYLQAVLADPSQSEGAALSNGLHLVICEN